MLRILTRLLFLAGLIARWLIFPTGASAQFDVPVDLSIAEAKGEIVVSDIDNDGLPDVVSVNKEGPMWYRNLGGGVFDEVQLLSSVGVAQTEWGLTLITTTSVQAGDVTGDGLPEIVIASAAGDIICYLNTGGSFNGDSIVIGSWLPEGITDPPTLRTIRLVDVNDDGDLDLVIAHRLHGIKCWDNLGNGMFGPLRHLASTGDWLNSMEMADVNMDGLVDLVHAHDNSGDHVSLHLNVGNGEFGTPFTITSNPTDPVSVQIADINNDGFPDIGVNHAIDGSVRVYVNNGSGSFPTSVVALSAAGNVNRIRLADITGDGNSDVLYSYNGTAVIYVAGNGAGVFGPPTILTDSLNGPDHLQVHDMDGDGDPDLVSSGDPMSLFLNNGVTGDWVQREIARPFAEGTITGDVDNDGDNDVICWYGWRRGGLFLLRNNGSGFDPLQYIYKGLNDPGDVHLADMDNDGILDIALATKGSTGSDQILIGKGTGNGTWFPLGVAYSSYEIYSLKVGDLNNDNAAELLVLAMPAQFTGYSLRVRMNNGDGIFSGGSTLTDMQSAFVVDMNNDGVNDVAWVSFGNLHWKTYTGSSWSVGPSITIPEPEMHPAFFDMDGDGIGDIVLSGSQQVWLKGIGDGTYEEASSLLTTSPFAKMRAADMDGDGMVDLIVHLPVGLVWYRNLGQGAFDQQEHIILLDNNIEDGSDIHELNGISVADLDGDGAQDVILEYPRTITGDRVCYFRNLVDLSTTVNERAPLSISIFPNPMSSHAKMISSKVLGERDLLRLMDLQGRAVATYTGNGTTEIVIQRGLLSAGMYLIEAQLKEERIVMPIVVD